MNNTKKNNLKQILYLLSGAIASLVILWGGLLYSERSYKDKVNAQLISEQEINVMQLEARIQKELNETLSSPQEGREAILESIVQDILMTYPRSDKQYAFFYSDEAILFEKDQLTTESYRGESMESITERWQLQGGSNWEVLQVDWMVGKNGSASIQKSSESHWEMMSWKTFQVDDHTYVIGLCKEQNYLDKKIGRNEFVSNLFVIIALVSFIWLGLLGGMTLTLYFKKAELEKLNANYELKNIQYQKIVQQLQEKDKLIQQMSLYDSLTGVYRKEVFEKVLPQMDKELFLPLASMIFEITEVKGQGEKLSEQGLDEAIVSLAKILKKRVSDKDILARIGHNQLVILATNCQIEQAYAFGDIIKREWKKQVKDPRLAIRIGIASQLFLEEPLARTVESAKENLAKGNLIEESIIKRNLIKEVELKRNLIKETLIKDKSKKEVF